jgi:hypothetical protein
MKRPRSVVIAPFDSRADGVVDAARRALTNIGVDVFSFDDLSGGSAWGTAILDAITVSDFVVVDITEQNPNVFYELGIAHAMRKPTILMAMSESGRRIPSDLAGFDYIVYDPGDMKSLTRHLQRAASAYMPTEAKVG